MPDEETEKFELTVQQEADLAQSANEWINLLIEKKLVDPHKHVEIAVVIVRVMRDTAIGAMKEHQLMGKTLVETRDHLSKMTEQAGRAAEHGVTLANHLNVANVITDVMAETLGLISSQECDCSHTIGVNHEDGCSVKLAQDCLEKAKTAMESLTDG